MAGRANQSDQTEAITKVLAVATHADSIRAHVRDVVESPAFRGSKRSQQFLRFVVDNALEGRFEELKERTLGTKLFGRAADYTTSDDAIVRVTASDVRKRLYHFYTEGESPSDYQIDLPLGSYIPDIRQLRAKELAAAPACEPDQRDLSRLAVLEPGSSAGHLNPLAIPPEKPGRSIVRELVSLGAVLAMCSAAWFVYNLRAGANRDALEAVLPWSLLIQSGRELKVIFCDPELVIIQRLTDSSVSLSDYANGHYWPSAPAIQPEGKALELAAAFRGVSVAAVDAAATVKIASLGARTLTTYPARSIRMADFQTESGFILFGSPRSNPWVDLFQNQLDFRFDFDPTRKIEFIRNARPLKEEALAYVPTAAGWGTGQAYAIVALVSNLNQKSKVLILAGSNAEATEAAGRFCTDKNAISRTLRAAGINPNSAQHFEVLLRVSTMAGSPNTFDVVACHALKSRS